MLCCHQHKLKAELETIWPGGFQFLLKVSRDQGLEKVRRLSQSAAHEGAAAQSDVGPDGAKCKGAVAAAHEGAAAHRTSLEPAPDDNTKKASIPIFQISAALTF